MMSVWRANEHEPARLRHPVRTRLRRRVSRRPALLPHGRAAGRSDGRAGAALRPAADDGLDRDAALPRRNHRPRRPAAQRRAGLAMKRALTLRHIGKTAGVIVLVVVALDVVATAATLALGIRMLQR